MVEGTPAVRDEAPDTALSEVQIGVLDGALFEAYFADLEECADVRSVTLKRGPETYAEEPRGSLEQAHLLMLVGSIRGVQIRYSFQGIAWIDTLAAQGDSVRLVRVTDPVQPADARQRRRLPLVDP